MREEGSGVHSLCRCCLTRANRKKEKKKKKKKEMIESARVMCVR